MSFFKFINQDAAANRNNTKGRIVTFLFRIGFYVYQNKVSKIIFSPYLFFYRIFIEWLLGIELPYNTVVGRGLRIYHGQGTVVHKDVVIGNNFTLRHNTTIGNSAENGRTPTIGNNVEVGANVCIVGAIDIGHNVKIGAGSVVVKSVPPFSVVVGNPAKVVRTLEPEKSSSFI